MSIEARIRQKLMVGLAPTRLDVVNESHMHAGHASSPGTGESHFRVLVVSPVFSGQSRIARHRAVTDLLGDEFRDGLHALAIQAKTPEEAAS